MNSDAPKVRWNKARVIERAGALADQEGLGALSLTRLAADLGIRPPSLFNHVDSLEGLVHDLAAGALAELADRIDVAAAGTTPAEALQAMLGAYRSFVEAHPGRYAATLAVPAAQAALDPELAAADRRIVSTGLRIAAEFGLSGSDALHQLRAWRALAHGFSDLERLGGFGIPLDQDESWRRAMAALTPSQAPR